MNDDALEGRLLAHRRILQLVVGALAGTPAGDRLLVLRERSTLRDGQEDPGAVLDGVLAVEFAVAEEFRLLVDGIPALGAREDAAPPSGPERAPDLPPPGTSRNRRG